MATYFSVIIDTVTTNEYYTPSNIVNRTNEESMDITDIVKPDYGVLIQELIWVRDSVSTHQHLGVSLEDSTLLVEVVDNIRNYLKLLSDTINITDTATSKHGVSINEILSTHERLISGWHGIVSLIDGANFNEGISSDLIYTKAIQEQLSVTSKSEYVFTAYLLLNDIVTSSTQITPNRSISQECICELTLSTSTVQRLVLGTKLVDEVTLSFTLTINGEEYQCWSFTTDKFLPSLYTNYDFNSYTSLDDKVYGCRPDGIYLLEGEDDSTTPIESGVDLNYNTFGIHNKKRLTYAHFGLIGTNPAIKIVADNGEYEYYVINGHAKIGRGLESRRWDIKLTSVDKLAFVDIKPVILTR